MLAWSAANLVASTHKQHCRLMSEINWSDLRNSLRTPVVVPCYHLAIHSWVRCLFELTNGLSTKLKFNITHPGSHWMEFAVIAPIQMQESRRSCLNNFTLFFLFVSHVAHVERLSLPECPKQAASANSNNIINNGYCHPKHVTASISYQSPLSNYWSDNVVLVKRTTEAVSYFLCKSVVNGLSHFV